MELVVEKYTPADLVTFNYEELKAQIAGQMEMYKSLVYTEDAYDQAKKDRAKLNNFEKVLKQKRKDEYDKFFEGFKDFEAKMKELEGMVAETSKVIDKQVKAFEEEQKATKREQIGSIWQNIEHPEWLTLPKVFNEKWLNKTVTIKSIELELIDKVAQINRDLDTIKALDSFAFEAETEYKRTLDLAKAIEEGKRQADIQKAKAEAVKVEETGFMAEIAKDEPRMWVAFQAYVTIAQAKELKAYFNAHGIEFKAV